MKKSSLEIAKFSDERLNFKNIKNLLKPNILGGFSMNILQLYAFDLARHKYRAAMPFTKREGSRNIVRPF